LFPAAAEPSLPFFIEWDSGTRLPGRSTAQHLVGPAGISRLILDGDPGRLLRWLGSHQLPIAIRTGKPRLAALIVSTAAEDVVVGSRAN